MSSYASLMVNLDLGPHAASRTALAVGLAERFHARLIGSASRCIIPALPLEAGFSAQTLIEQWREIAAEELQQIEANFIKVAKSGESTSLRTGMDETAPFLLEQASAADLLIVGRQGSGDHRDWRFAVDPGAIVLEAGRPVLLVPPTSDRLSAQRIVIAWKNTREARRAVCDALPFLKTAEGVFVVTAGESAERSSAQDLQDYLRHHGITADLVQDSAMREARIADELIHRARQEGADLLVSGAYGHSRTREWIFGGVTRDLLDHASICCLMSH
ncbi:universal stress protein [Bosea sp. 2YAB26]|uniref:universal stress protein n=1 Tax=Bosea sp. 2YAB26 TaxID=3237478 RepID=UPI003F933D86